MERYRASAEQGFAPAQAALGKAYLDGVGVARNQQEAFNWFWKSAVQGNGEGQYGAGNIYAIRGQTDQAIPWYWEAAEQGFAAAQAAMAVVYSSGLGVLADYDRAAMWATRAAQQGDDLGLSMLARFYAQGIVVAKDMAAARHYFGLRLAKHEPLAADGDPKAQVALGRIYEFGPPDLQDYGEAMKWYRKAAGQDYAEAKYRIGQMHRYGRGVTENLNEAISWLRQAAEQGFLEAAYELGTLCDDDDRTGMRSQTEAAIWYLYAASRGHSFSQVKLGDLSISYFLNSNNSNTKTEFLNSALYWWCKAAEQGEDFVVSSLVMSTFLSREADQ